MDTLAPTRRMARRVHSVSGAERSGLARIRLQPNRCTRALIVSLASSERVGFGNTQLTQIESTRAPALEVCGSTGAAYGERNGVNGGLEPCYVGAGSPGPAKQACRRKLDEHRSSREPSGGIVPNRTVRFDKVAAIDRGVRSDESGSTGSIRNGR